MKKIKLNQRPSKAHQNYFALVDDEDFERVNKHKWSAMRGHSGIYYAVMNPDNKKLVYMHRFVLDAPKGTIVDHKNRNGLDNQKNNLRYCTYSQNAMNSKAPTTNTSGHKGVYWDSDRRKWAVQMVVDQKNIHLGRYSELKEAIKARKEAEKQYFNNFI